MLTPITPQVVKIKHYLYPRSHGNPDGYYYLHITLSNGIEFDCPEATITCARQLLSRIMANKRSTLECKDFAGNEWHLVFADRVEIMPATRARKPQRKLKR